MIRAMMLIPMLAAVAGLRTCSGANRRSGCAVVVSNAHTAPAGGTAERAADPVPTTEEEEVTFVFTSDVLAVNYGDALIEEKILNSDAIVKATMTSHSSEVFADAEGKFLSALKFNLDVSEYLKGSGPTSIVALWIDGRSYETRENAQRAEAKTLAQRDDQWDDRAAIVFLYDGASGFGARLDGQFQLADHFLLGVWA